MQWSYFVSSIVIEFQSAHTWIIERIRVILSSLKKPTAFAIIIASFTWSVYLTWSINSLLIIDEADVYVCLIYFSDKIIVSVNLRLLLLFIYRIKEWEGNKFTWVTRVCHWKWINGFIRFFLIRLIWLRLWEYIWSGCLLHNMRPPTDPNISSPEYSHLVFGFFIKSGWLKSLIILREFLSLIVISDSMSVINEKRITMSAVRLRPKTRTVFI
jgi:hypothetical protein